MRKLLSLFVLLLFACPFLVSQEMTLSNHTLTLDEQSVLLQVQYSGIDSSIALEAGIRYDQSALQLDTVQQGAGITGWELFGFHQDQDTLKIAGGGTQAVQGSGVFATLRFDVLLTSPGETTLTFDYAYADTTALPVQGGTVTVRSGLAGDVNQDGTVTLADAQEILARVLGRSVEWTTWQKTLADVDANGEIQAHDCSLVLNAL